MRRNHHLRALISLGAIVGFACRESTSPTPGATGAIAITVLTSGASADLDPDGYEVRLDNGQAWKLAVHDTITITASRGSHSLRLDGISLDCTLAGANPRLVDVTSAVTPVAVTFSITCVVNRGSIRVSTTTLGDDQDVDGYSVTLSGANKVAIPSNGTVTFTEVRPGGYQLRLGDVSGNCVVDAPNPHPITLEPGGTLDVAFVIRCVKGTRLTVTVTTTGPHPDPDGYLIQLYSDAGNYVASGDVSSNGTRAFPALVPADYRLEVRDIMPNCNESLPNPISVSIPAGRDTSINFDIVCDTPQTLAVVRGVDTSAEIYLVNSDGSGQVRLTSNSAADSDPSWSPDGSKIAFTSKRDGNLEIYVMNGDGTNVQQLTNVASPDYDAAWSPDGAKIAFVSERDGNAEIYVMNTDGTGVIRLTNNPGADVNPAWSPDGHTIAFSSDRDSRRGIWTMSSDGAIQRRITPVTGGSQFQPAWSPDGTRILFSGTASALLPRQIFIMNADGSGIRQLTLGPDFAVDPSWSADGRKIAFTASSYGYTYIAIINTSGVDYSYVPEFGIFVTPVWRP